MRPIWARTDGNALAIGGLKEKLLAALRGGIKTVLIPEENETSMITDMSSMRDTTRDDKML